MDPQTVIAVCDLMLVVIGIIGLVLMRKEWVNSQKVCLRIIHSPRSYSSF